MTLFVSPNADKEKIFTTVLYDAKPSVEKSAKQLSIPHLPLR